MNLLSEYSHMTDELQLPEGYTRCKAVKFVTRNSSFNLYRPLPNYPIKGYIDCYIYEPDPTGYRRYIMWQRSHSGTGLVRVYNNEYDAGNAANAINDVNANLRRSLYFDYSNEKLLIKAEGKVSEGTSYPDRYITVGCSTYDGGCLMMVFGVYIVNDDNEIIEVYIPAIRNSDSNVGMYCYYSKTFVSGSTGNNALEAIF